MFGRRKFRSIKEGELIRCPNCVTWLPVGQFSLVAGRAGTGRQSYCKSCASKVKRSPRSPESVKRNLLRQRLNYQAAPEKAYQKKAVRRARLANVPSERIERNQVYFTWQGLCGICWNMVDPENWHLDHIVPIVKGGAHLFSNVQPAHPFCNISKGARL